MFAYFAFYGIIPPHWIDRSIFGKDNTMAMGFITKVKRFFAQADLILLALCCAAALFGILLIASATNYTG